MNNRLRILSMAETRLPTSFNCLFDCFRLIAALFPPLIYYRRRRLAEISLTGLSSVSHAVAMMIFAFQLFVFIQVGGLIYPMVTTCGQVILLGFFQWRLVLQVLERISSPLVRCLRATYTFLF